MGALRLVYFLALCAVLLVFFINLKWHRSQSGIISSFPGDQLIVDKLPSDSASLVSVSDMVGIMEANSASSSKRDEPTPISVLDQLKGAEVMQGNANIVADKSIPPHIEKISPTLVPAPPTQKQKQGQTVHVVTYASHGGRDDRFCRAVESALRHDIELVILGWGVKWQGLSQKLEASHAYAASLPKGDVMLFTDAFDVMFTNSSDNILQIFEKMNTNILFAGECGCWPHVMENKGQACFVDYPKSPTPYRYLNSGTWIAKAGSAKDMLLAVIEEAGKNFANANDQKLVADMYIQGRFGIKLDFYSEIFQSMHMTLSKPLPFCNPTKDVVIINGHFHNKLTKTDPSVFHFNGGGKSVHLKMVFCNIYNVVLLLS
jgi:hypothetical protein